MDELDWISAAGAALGAGSALAPGALQVDGDTAETLLEVAAFAAHDSGDRRNAPLLCYLLGRAEAAGPAGLDDLVATVRAALSS